MKKYVDVLLNWFKENKRDLEWRWDSSAYSILVSEVMLQQTRAHAVRPYYTRFMRVLPDFTALANVEDEKLYKLWEGLGYYSRARNLKKCAIEVVNTYNGIFPDTYEQALALPGIGMYTAGAILSRAYNLKYAAIDGNVLRVLSRFYCDDKDILKDSTKQFYKHKIEEIMPNEAGYFNEALMELGATICMPKIAKCEECPIRYDCKARIHNLVFEYPKKAEKKEKQVFEYTCLFLTDGKRYLFLPKPNGVLKDMPSPILIPKFLDRLDALEYPSSLHLTAINEVELHQHTHIFTHQIWHMKGYRILVQSLDEYPSYTKDEVQTRLGIPTAFKKFLPEVFECE